MDRLEVQEQASDVAEPAESDAHLVSKLERLSAPLAEKKEWMADLEGMAPTGQEGSVTTWEARPARTIRRAR